MGYMRKYTCPYCKTTSSVNRQRKRQQSIVYYCKGCHKYFSIKTTYCNTRQILSDHLDGFSFRKLALRYDISPMTAWRICEQELKKLPDNNQITLQYCNRFSHTLVCDGKYFNVASTRYDYCLLWGIDYFTHDIPICIIAPSESYASWSRYFSYFRIIAQRPELLVCDDNVNLKMAARSILPQVRIQTCYNHFKENIRRSLRVRSDEQYRPFMKRIEEIFKVKMNDDAINKKLFMLFRDYHTDPIALSILTNIQRYMPELTAYRGIPQSPITTNIIEGLNSHLEARLHPLRSFQSVAYAKLWMNAYILKRRTTKWTDCTGKFRLLQGKTGLERTIKQGLDVPTFF